MFKLLAGITLSLLIAIPAAARTYTGGIPEVTAILNANPQIIPEEADAIHAKSRSLKVAEARLDEFCSGKPSVSRTRRCDFAKGVYFQDALRLLDRARSAAEGIYKKKMKPEDPRCAIARKFNDPSLVPDGVECEL